MASRTFYALWYWRRVRVRRRRPASAASAKEYKLLKEEARTVITERVEYFAGLYGFQYGKIAIRNQRSRWGSCSKSGNLNFNYRLVKLPAHLRDYVVAHEICHLGQFNHSRAFWNLLSRAIPNYVSCRHELRRQKM